MCPLSSLSSWLMNFSISSSEIGFSLVRRNAKEDRKQNRRRAGKGKEWRDGEEKGKGKC